MPQPPRITVLGSLNMDISVTVLRLAGPGETVLGSAARLQPGGKGANQAVAAARLGASVRMAGCCGDDDFGRTLRSALEAAGVDFIVSGIADVARVRTTWFCDPWGVVFILVEKVRKPENAYYRQY